ncbi:MAG: cysteine--tRNA ligase [Clostridiales bacterium]|nr:cysteine--tRNA ligase [Clostridiales bacterium]
MRFYNTLTKQKDEFTPLNGNNVRMYACGPTVYNFFHIGNARCFVVFDMLRRYLEYRGYNVTFVQNFTDVDDKMIKRANEEGTTVKDIAERYIGEYFTDAKGLGIRPATIHPRATENIDEIIKIVSTLIEKGHAYAAPSANEEGAQDVYFRTLSFKEYGKLSHMPIDELEKGARIDISEHKEDALDFALWKAAKPGEPYWESPWGKGRPGWHIECSAMVLRYLGETIDIHCGGQDLTFPHHENEVAQSECCTGKPFARFWMHNGYINVNNTKMSKSLGNFFTVRDVAEKYGYPAIRFFILSAHYRSPINFSAEIIEQSKNALERISNCADNLKFYLKSAVEGELTAEAKSAIDQHKADFIAAMDDDLNTADAIAAIFELVRDANELIAKNASGADAKYALTLLDELCTLMGFTSEEAADDEFIKEIEDAIERRMAAKKSKDYAAADKIRAELLEKGVILEDTPKGTKYRIER